ncbi:MAG: phosphate ABC transporter substrate-binding protein [Candidatus Hydrogenedentes bacterium]|nr:phosphate ABC transporter substrate-binding protein [Candidatus Hydrogenedentota bacterium]
MNRSLTLFPLYALISALTVLGCGPKQQSAAPTPSSEDRSSAITIKGSDTMLHLVTAWADAYMKSHAGATVSVTGGGSGTGIASLLNGTTSICASSRDVNEEEQKLAAQKGLTLHPIVVARDAITIVVNPANPVSELSVEQLKKIYTGAYTTWDQLGGPAEPIVVLSRESSSGTYMFFLEHVLNKEDYSSSAMLLPATSAIIQSVSDSPWAIGYVGLGYAEEAAQKVKILPVKKDAQSPAVMPTEATVASGEYSIARPLLLVTAGEPAGDIKAFIDSCLSPEGQKLVAATGYVTVK